MQQRAERRRGIFADLDPGTLLDIEQMMTEVNPFAQQFLNFAERLRQDQAEEKTSSIWFQPNVRPPLLLLRRELGWTYTDTYANNIERRNKREMSFRERVAYRLYQKIDDQSVIHQGGRLFQQYCIDQRAKCEQEQLWWIATHQAEQRVDQYCGFQDALLSETTVELGEGEALRSENNRETGTLQLLGQPRCRSGHFLNLDQIGKRVVHPSIHSGGPLHMFMPFQDAMDVVREFGKMDVFVTMPCHPTWDEIQAKIPDENQSAQDRPGIVARVEINDKLVSAELPDLETNPQLYETILTCMMHGPCGAANPSCVYMKDGKCTKGYPKPLTDVTQENVNGFPVCRRRRRPPGILKSRGREYDNATINQWVVPYNSYLSHKYNCHINVEPNEILRYLNARYISPVEACMRLLGFAIQGKTHSIVQLTIHLENEQVVTFRSSDNRDRVLTCGRHTMLTRFLELCACDAPENQIAKTMIYQDMPKEFRWDAKAKRWVRRKHFQAALGRMVHVSPRDMEWFYLRVLLCHHKGPHSFEHLRTVDGVTYETCHQEVLRLGILKDDAE
ncbi:unnamed protein product [Phytophthora fragariaefolia]|uniref:Unnamed protein product n=1 Tax=Phytophthora fragariaefolia TaxID=1490495 RepID=A0A9W6X5E3_9STRA|nr:unnamed protein product [Phytophthora fragariaefolia]